ncbi:MULTISPECIES: M13-type metalloendopeptidase [unclassified Sphingomonas]|nr:MULTISPECIES: M13-type metalloendopeptidase [unclassified Sphingomonas]
MRDRPAGARLLTNPHSLHFHRGNGIVRNVDAWYAAFGMKSGDAMHHAPA